MELNHNLMSWVLIVTGNQSLMVTDPSSLYVCVCVYVIHPTFQILKAQQFTLMCNGMCNCCMLYGVNHFISLTIVMLILN